MTTKEQNEELYEIIMEKLSVKKQQTFYGTHDLPAIVLANPAYSRNVAMVIRIAANWAARTVMFTGDRVIAELFARSKESGKVRFLREERMKAYNHVKIVHANYPLNCFDIDSGIVPVAVEKLDGAEWLFDFEHPEHAVYVFGPEDGSIPNPLLRLCHRRVIIPTMECENLAVSVAHVLSDRARKLGVVTRDDMIDIGGTPYRT